MVPVVWVFSKTAAFPINSSQVEAGPVIKTKYSFQFLCIFQFLRHEGNDDRTGFNLYLEQMSLTINNSFDNEKCKN